MIYCLKLFCFEYSDAGFVYKASYQEEGVLLFSFTFVIMHHALCEEQLLRLGLFYIFNFFKFYLTKIWIIVVSAVCYTLNCQNVKPICDPGPQNHS